MATKIHLNLESLHISKTDIHHVVFGLYMYARGKRLSPPYRYTTNVNTEDISYLGVLKNNNVQILESAPDPESVNIMLDATRWNPTSINRLKLYSNMPIFNVKRACVYIDWDNVQVSFENIKHLLWGIKSFVSAIKVHPIYNFYVFTHRKTSPAVVDELKKYGAIIVLIVKDKSNSGDGEILRFIRQNTQSSDSICVASGDRDFSPLMIKYVRDSHNVFLVYNKQALHTFKHNKHWLGSVETMSLKNMIIKKPSDKAPRHSHQKTKPCKFYNLDTCKAVSCNFLHICGYCGRPHKMQDFHPRASAVKNIICNKYNHSHRNACVHSRLTCDYLHVCANCKKPHPVSECESSIILRCPLCHIRMVSKQEYVMHMLDADHIKRVDLFKKIMDRDGQNDASNDDQNDQNDASNDDQCSESTTNTVNTIMTNEFNLIV
jgi:hypothetical protein